MSQPGVTGVLCSDNQGLALAGELKIDDDILVNYAVLTYNYYVHV